jgi:hypothetical protein
MKRKERTYIEEWLTTGSVILATKKVGKVFVR